MNTAAFGCIGERAGGGGGGPRASRAAGRAGEAFGMAARGSLGRNLEGNKERHMN